MIKQLAVFILLCITSAGIAQPFQTGRTSITFTDNTRNNRIIAAEIYYPAATNGTGVPVAGMYEQFPVVVFGHGFVIPYNSYSWLADSLVKNGYIVAFPNTENSFSPDHEQFGRDIAFLCESIPGLNDSAQSVLYGRVLKKCAVSGHSMGGGASFLSATYSNNTNAIFNFAAAETNPSAKAAASQLQLPTLIFAGSRDCIVPDSNQYSMFQRIPYACKSFVNITDALHCQFANNNSTCATGQVFSGCNSSPISTQTVFQKTIRLLIPFLNYYLKDSCADKSVFENRLSNTPGIVKEYSCTSDPFVCNPSSTYVFTGNGNYDIGTNWLNNLIPPSPLPAGSQIIINPTGNLPCILNVQQVIAPGAGIVLKQGKNMIIEGSLYIQQ